MRDLDAPFDRLQALPHALWLPTLITAVGEPSRRLSDVPQWLAALDAGELPDAALDFADAPALRAMRAQVAALELPALCRGAPALAQQVLRTMLWHLDRINDHLPALPRVDAIGLEARGFHDEWEIQKGGWEAVLALMHGLGELSRLNWDQLQGMLRSREWQDAQRISALLAHLQPLVELIRSLGRAQHHPQRPVTPSTAPLSRSETMPQRERETRLPDAPGELRGIRHSARLERMLGSEAMQIRHPVLHKLWRARLAESRLLTYESEAVMIERVPDPSAQRHRQAMQVPEALERGPMILCVDTSGSMQGAPENIAKAVVLEAVRTASREGRACRLIAFGGPGELIERDLDLSVQGLQHLLEVLGQSFDGGTDVQTPIERAIDAVHTQGWSSADLLIVSDGEFGCTAGTLERLDGAREELGLRVQGILVGDRETMGLLEVCDGIHWLRDWRRYDAAAPKREGFVPVHTASLTALYFPNALSERAARHRRG
jgi:uncharacterized protein with von Willebrand factor type A (vWA) domain